MNCQALIPSRLVLILLHDSAPVEILLRVLRFDMMAADCCPERRRCVLRLACLKLRDLLDTVEKYECPRAILAEFDMGTMTNLLDEAATELKSLGVGFHDNSKMLLNSDGTFQALRLSNLTFLAQFCTDKNCVTLRNASYDEYNEWQTKRIMLLFGLITMPWDKFKPEIEFAKEFLRSYIWKETEWIGWDTSMKYFVQYVSTSEAGISVGMMRKLRFWLKLFDQYETIQGRKSEKDIRTDHGTAIVYGIIHQFKEMDAIMQRWGLCIIELMQYFAYALSTINAFLMPFVTPDHAKNLRSTNKNILQRLTGETLIMDGEAYKNWELTYATFVVEFHQKTVKLSTQ